VKWITPEACNDQPWYVACFCGFRSGRPMKGGAGMTPGEKHIFVANDNDDFLALM
jgi:hypothetical protein